MEVDEIPTGHNFQICNNIAIFKIDIITKFPNVRSLLPNDIVINNLFISAESSPTQKTLSNLSITGIGGTNNNTIVYLMGKSEDIMTKLLDVIVQAFPNKLYLKLRNLEDKILPDILKFYASYGFSNPQKTAENMLVLSYRRIIPISETIQNSLAISNAIINNTSTLKIFFPRSLATMISKYMVSDREVSGKLLIKSYVNDVAILTFNEESLIQGSVDKFQVKFPTGALSFHTHPDICYRKYGCFVGWPSGIDMKVIPSQYLYNNDILAHFVVSSEGLWVIHMTYEFQKILKHLKTIKARSCAEILIKTIGKEFNKFDAGRQAKLVDPMERHTVKKTYLDIVNAFTILKLTEAVPDIIEKCKSKCTTNTPLYNVRLIKWKEFDNSQNGINMSFVYIPDTLGGLSPYLPVNKMCKPII
jgi:hypothetical protein